MKKSGTRVRKNLSISGTIVYKQKSEKTFLYLDQVNTQYSSRPKIEDYEDYLSGVHACLGLEMMVIACTIPQLIKCTYLRRK